MPVPSDPTVTSIVTQALKRAGRTNPTATQINEATDHALQEVKADIMLVCPTHPHLQFTAITTTVKGQQRYSIPVNANEHDCIALLDGPTDWRGTFTAASSTGFTFPAAIVVQPDDIIGKMLLVTAGTGQYDYRAILDYDAGTRIGVIDFAWTATPTAASTFLIVNEQKQLWPQDAKTDLDKLRAQFVLGTPDRAAIFNQQFLLYPIPNLATYGLYHRYWTDISKVDETSTLFVQLLREWRSVWIQGVAVKSMQRFDEDRYQSELQVYKQMLDFLGSQTCRVSQMRQAD